MLARFAPSFRVASPDCRMRVVLGYRSDVRRADRDDRGASGAIPEPRRSVANASPKVGLRLVGMGETRGCYR